MDFSLTLFRPLVIGKGTFNIYNCDFSIHGSMLYSEDSFNLQSVNVTFMYDYAVLGFLLATSCNYPEAIVEGEVLIKNNSISYMVDIYSPGYY